VQIVSENIILVLSMATSSLANLIFSDNFYIATKVRGLNQGLVECARQFSPRCSPMRCEMKVSVWKYERSARHHLTVVWQNYSIFQRLR